MSDSDGVCRACLGFGLKLHRISDKKLLGMYEKLATSSLLIGEDQPNTLCYVCYWQLKRSLRFSDMVHRSEKYLKDIFLNNLKVTKQTVSTLNIITSPTLTIRPAVSVSYNGATDDATEPLPDSYTPSIDGSVSNTPILPSSSISSLDAYNEIPIKEEYIEECVEEIFTKTERVSSEEMDLIDKQEFTCVECKESFTAEKLFLMHIGSSHNKTTYCGKCNKLFSSYHALSSHMLSHTSRKLHVCNLCNRTFYKKLHFTEHTKMHEEKPYFCVICNIGFVSSDELKKHMKTHDKRFQFSCTHCSKRFQYVSGLKRHMVSHSGEKPYVCCKCNASFRDNPSLKKHMSTHLSFVCNKCNKIFNSGVTYERHLLFHNKTKHACVICGEKFDDNSALDKHMHSTHIETVETIENSDKTCSVGEKPQKPLPDSINLDNDSIPATLIKYVEAYQGKQRHRPQCPVCKRHQHSTSQLKAHMRIHTGEKPYTCNECGRSFRTATFLKCHIRTHTGEKVCSCEICGQSFTQTSSLNKHMVLHTGELPHACQLCDKAYKQRGQLTAHIKNLHQGVRYFCDLCNSSFTAKQHLKRHMNSHAGVKPYSCVKCSQKFTTQTSVNRHMKNSCK